MARRPVIGQTVTGRARDGSRQNEMQMLSVYYSPKGLCLEV